MMNTGRIMRHRHSRPHEYPQRLAHDEPSNKRRYVVGIKRAKRLDREPLEPDPRTRPEARRDLEEVVAARSREMRQRHGKPPEKRSVVIVIWRRRRLYTLSAFVTVVCFGRKFIRRGLGEFVARFWGRMKVSRECQISCFARARPRRRPDRFPL